MAAAAAVQQCRRQRGRHPLSVGASVGFVWSDGDARDVTKLIIFFDLYFELKVSDTGSVGNGARACRRRAGGASLTARAVDSTHLISVSLTVARVGRSQGCAASSPAEGSTPAGAGSPPAKQEQTTGVEKDGAAAGVDDTKAKDAAAAELQAAATGYLQKKREASALAPAPAPAASDAGIGIIDGLLGMFSQRAAPSPAPEPAAPLTQAAVAAPATEPASAVTTTDVKVETAAPAAAPAKLEAVVKKPAKPSPFPTVTYCTRSLAEMRMFDRECEDYKDKFDTLVKADVAKVSIAFFDKNDASTVHELYLCTDQASHKKWKAKFGKLPGSVICTVTFGTADAPLLAGYILPSSCVAGPPIITISKRAAKAGELAALTEGMAAVCDAWQTQLPSMVAAAIVAAPDEPDTVWELRWMGDWECVEQHVGVVEGPALMGGVVDHYDTANHPFTGILVSNDCSEYTSSDAEGYTRFDYGEEGMTGAMLGAVPGP